MDLKMNDILLDPACGTEAFLIAGMNKRVEMIQESHLPDKKTRIDNIRINPLIGIEKSTTMFTLAISIE